MRGWGIGGMGSDLGALARTDSSGNSIVAGIFSDTIDVEPGAGVTSLTNAGGLDMFICKYDTMGGLLWAASLGGSGDELISDLAVDGAGNVLLTGLFDGTVDFDPGAGVANLSTSSLGAAFVCKLDSNGGYLWAVNAGEGTYAQGFSIDADSLGNVFLTGYFLAAVDLDPGPGTFSVSSAGGVDAFVSALDSSGNFQWGLGLGGSGPDTGRAVASDGIGGLYLTGGFSGTVDFDPGAGTTNLTSIGGGDVYVCRLDGAGALQWAVSTGGTSADTPWGIETAGGEVYIVGDFQGTADFDPSPGTLTQTSAGDRDAFVWKLDDMGAVEWVRVIGGADFDGVYDVTLDGAGLVHLGGQFVGSADFNRAGSPYILSASGITDGYVCTLNTSGDFVWAGAVGGTDEDAVTSISADGAGGVAIAGAFAGTIDLDPGSGMSAVASAGDYDLFVALLQPALTGMPIGNGWGMAGLTVILASVGFLALRGTYPGHAKD